MKSNNNFIRWAMQNYRITFLIVILLLGIGLIGIDKIPKQEFPEFTIRQGVVIGVYPGASVQEIEQQLARPLERYLFTFKEVKRDKTTSTSKDGMCFIMVELNDEVNNKDEVWSKIKHGLNSFKNQLPAGVLALVANDDFGDTSALLISIESGTRSYRELEKYSDDLSDRLRQIKSVSNIRSYGNIKEQITLSIDKQRLSAYGLNEGLLISKLKTHGLTTGGGKLSGRNSAIPIHLSPSICNEQEIADLIIYSDNQNNVVRVKDIARIKREYDLSESYISSNGNRTIILSLEMRNGFNIVKYGKDVDKVLELFKEQYLPEDVQIDRIADQAKVVDESVTSFLRDLILSIIIIIIVMMILFPFRSALVASITIPLSTFISIGIMYMVGIPLNTVTLAALIVVLGMIVDNSIVVIDGYLEYLNKGYSRWNAAITSATIYFMPMLLATFCICVIFFPLLITMTGQTGDFIRFFPWTITINLMVSLLIAVLVMPYIEFMVIKKAEKKENGKKEITDYVQEFYEKVLKWTFKHPNLTISAGIFSVVISVAVSLLLKVRMMPVADRDQFAVEIYLPKGKDLADTESVTDSIQNLLKKDQRVKSITSFIGCSSPRFQTAYAPQMASENYAQFIVNTTSAEDTEAILDEYTNTYSEAFPEAYVKFKQLDYQMVPSIEFRFYGDDIDSLYYSAELLMQQLREMPELMWVHSDYEYPRAVAEVELDATAAGRLGVNRSSAALNLTMASNSIAVGEIWEGNYRLPVKIKSEDKDDIDMEKLQDVHISSLLGTGTSIPLRQIASVSPVLKESQIVHRNGVRCISVLADIKRGENSMALISRIQKIIDNEISQILPEGITTQTGGEIENNEEIMPPLMTGIGISMIIIFFFILINFKKFGITIVSILAMSLCLFGAMTGLLIAGKTISVTAVFGFITLLGMIVRNVILMFQHAENLRNNFRYSAHDAAFDAGRRRMIPIFLTTATTAVGVIPMITGGSSFWLPVGVIIFAGGIGSLILLVSILPVLYWKLYK